MKRFVLCIFILAGLAGLCVWSILKVESTTEDLTEKIHEVEKAFENKDSERCVQIARELYDDWEDFLDFSILINDVGQAMEISSSISEIYSLAKSGNEDLYTVCERTKVQIEVFRKVQFPAPWKVM